MYRKLKQVFGEGIVKADGSIDREALGKIVFTDAEARRKLNSITHPAVFKEIIKQLLFAILRVRHLYRLDA